MRTILIKSGIFIIVTVLATAALAATIRNDAGGSTSTYHGVFSDATSLNKGDDVRMAGVKVGSVDSINVTENRLAGVAFSVRNDVKIPEGTTAELRFRNLVGQRYISLEPPAEDAATLPKGHTFTVEQTRPALDLTALFNGFQPLLRFLSPEDVNNLSTEIIAVFQGEGATVEGLLSSTASLTSTIADKDQIIGELITSLSTVLTTINDRSDQLNSTIITLEQLVSGLAADRKTIGSTLDGLGNLTSSVAGLLDESRAPLKGSISALDDLSTNLADADDTINEFLQKLPVKLDRIGRLGSYGSWLNFYECSIRGTIPKPEGYYGDLGAQPIAQRCQA